MSLNDDIAADIAGEHVFYDKESGFAVDATVQPSGPTIQVIFDNDYVDVDTGGTPFAGSTPRAWCRTSQAPSVSATVLIGSASFIVRAVEPNNDGETLLVLQETSS